MASKKSLERSKKHLMSETYHLTTRLSSSGLGSRELLKLFRYTSVLKQVYRLASMVFHQFVASDNASESFAGLKRIHGLMPYFMLKTAMKISNPIGMIRSRFYFTHNRGFRILMHENRYFGSLYGSTFWRKEFNTKASYVP